MIALEGVQKRYRHPSGEIDVLSNVNISIKNGEQVAIIGPSGSGKSTLLSLLAGLDRPTSGRILVNGTDVGKLSERELTGFRARQLGIVFQQFHLMSHLTAEENVRLPLRILRVQDPFAPAKELLKKMGLADRMHHFPRQLSGGECQRVAIARAIVAKPQLILADEPSGNLDSHTGTMVMDVLFGLTQELGMTLVLVTHNEDLAKRCGRTLVLRSGCLTDA